MDNVLRRTLKAIKEVKESGVTNISDKKKVLFEISCNCKEDVKDFIYEHEDEYLFLLELSGKI